MLTPRQTNRPKITLISMCMKVTYNCCLVFPFSLLWPSLLTCSGCASMTATSLSFLEVFGFPTLFSLNYLANWYQVSSQVMLLTLCTNFQDFAHFALQSSPMKLYFWYLSYKHFPVITHQYILFAPLFLHLKHFETFALLCAVKGILLDIGLNLRYSLILQISNFPYLRKNLSPV